MNHQKTLPSLKELVSQPLYYPYPYCYLYYPPAPSEPSSSSATEPDIHEAQAVSVLQSLMLKRANSSDSELSLVSSYVSSNSSSFAQEKLTKKRKRKLQIKKKDHTPLNPEWVVPPPPWVQRAQQDDIPPVVQHKRPSRSNEDPPEDDPYQINWKQSLSIPQEIQDKAWKIYDRLVHMRELRLLHSGKKRKALMGGVIFILCRQEGHPRTFSEIAVAAGVQKKEIGHCFRWLLPYMSEEQTVPRVHPYEFISRWCQDLKLPEYVAPVCVEAYDVLSELLCFGSKCPSNLMASVIVAVIWAINCAQSLIKAPKSLSIRNLESLAHDTNPPRIAVDQRQVASVACIGITTLQSTFRMILPHWDKIISNDLLQKSWTLAFPAATPAAITTLPARIFSSPLRLDILHRCVVYFRDGLRQGNAATKGISDIRGSTRRGKARVGTIRAPHFRGGGVVFGPKPHNHSTKLQRKVQLLGLRVALSAKYAENRLTLVDTLALSEDFEGKSREFRTIASNFNLSTSNALLLAGNVDEKLQRACRNFPNIDLKTFDDATIVDLIKCDRLLIDSEALSKINHKLKVD